MTTDTIYKFFKVLEKDTISFSYRGSFSNNVLTMVTQLFKENVEEKHEKLRNKLSFLMIESFQNIRRENKQNLYQKHTQILYKQKTTSAHKTHEQFVRLTMDESGKIIGIIKAEFEPDL